MFIVSDNNFFLKKLAGTFWFTNLIIIWMFFEISKTDQRVRNKAGTEIGSHPVEFCLNVRSTECDIRFAVLADDAATIAKAPGIGAKTAKKLIVELKDKIAARETVDAVLEKAAERGGTQNTAPVAKASAEAVEALAALGYSAAESLKAVRQITNADELSTEELLKQALKLM